jgi:D-alanine-D-alanine ligase
MGRVAVAYNDDLHRKPHLNEVERLGEAEVLDTAREVAALTGGELVPVGDDLLAALDAVKRFDVVVDLCEGVLGRSDWEKNFALALEMLGVAHTSCDPIAVGLCGDKRLVKRLLGAAGLPTPREHVPAEEPSPGWPFIVKPSREDAGIGIDAASVVTTPEELEARVLFVEERYRQPALVEEFIEGRELNQSLYLGRVLPPGEVVFAADLAPRERIVGWKAKWAAGSREDLGTVNRTPADVDQATREELASLCLRAAELLGIDMAVRFDVRQAQDGRLFIVDINPNPDIGRGTGFRRALDAAGVSFSDFIGDLIIAARARRSR